MQPAVVPLPEIKEGIVPGQGGPNIGLLLSLTLLVMPFTDVL